MRANFKRSSGGMYGASRNQMSGGYVFPDKVTSFRCDAASGLGVDNTLSGSSSESSALFSIGIKGRPAANKNNCLFFLFEKASIYRFIVNNKRQYTQSFQIHFRFPYMYFFRIVGTVVERNICQICMGKNINELVCKEINERNIITR